MNSLDDLRVVCLKFSDVSGCGFEVFLNLFQHNFQVLGVQRESMVKYMLSLFTCFHHHNSDFINKVNLLDEHPGHPRPNKSHILEIHVKPNSFHTEITANYIEIVQVFCCIVIDYVTTVGKNLDSFLRCFARLINLPVNFSQVPGKLESDLLQHFCPLYIH